MIAQPASGFGTSADFLVDGKETELKSISKVKPQSSGEAITATIKEATKQAKNVVIDARNQRGLTAAKARRSVENAVADLPKSRINEVHLFGRNGNSPFEILVKK